MKRTAATVLTLLALAACGGDGTNAADDTASQAGTAPVAAGSAGAAGQADAAGSAALATAGSAAGLAAGARAVSSAGAGGTAALSGGVGGSAGVAGLAAVGGSGGGEAAGAAGVASTAGASAMPAAGSGGAGASGAVGSMQPASGPVTVYIAGDSTVSTYEDTSSTRDQAGWGQMLHEFVRSDAKIENRAIGGRTARRFIDDGYLDEIWSDIKAGDYLLVQFGTNDGNKSATYEHDGQTIPYYLDPATDFKTYLQKYIDGARMRGAIPVFVTPPPRNSAYCTGGNGTGAHAQAMRELAMAKQLPLSDLNDKSVTYLKAICPAPEPENFFLIKSDGTVDGTHFQEMGARKLAEFVAAGLREAGIPWVK